MEIPVISSFHLKYLHFCCRKRGQTYIIRPLFSGRPRPLQICSVTGFPHSHKGRSSAEGFGGEDTDAATLFSGTFDEGGREPGEELRGLEWMDFDGPDLI